MSDTRFPIVFKLKSITDKNSVLDLVKDKILGHMDNGLEISLSVNDDLKSTVKLILQRSDLVSDVREESVADTMINKVLEGVDVKKIVETLYGAEPDVRKYKPGIKLSYNSAGQYKTGTFERLDKTNEIVVIDNKNISLDDLGYEVDTPADIEFKKTFPRK